MISCQVLSWDDATLTISYLCLLVAAWTSIFAKKNKNLENQIVMMIGWVRQSEVICFLLVPLFLLFLPSATRNQNRVSFQRKKQAVKTNTFSIPDKVDSRNRILSDSYRCADLQLLAGNKYIFVTYHYHCLHCVALNIELLERTQAKSLVLAEIFSFPSSSILSLKKIKIVITPNQEMKDNSANIDHILT